MISSSDSGGAFKELSSSSSAESSWRPGDGCLLDTRQVEKSIEKHRSVASPTAETHREAVSASSYLHNVIFFFSDGS